MLLNRASGSGGGVFNAGIMTFETSADFRGNEAAVSAAAAVRAFDGVVTSGGGAFVSSSVVARLMACFLGAMMAGVFLRLETCPRCSNHRVSACTCCCEMPPLQL